MSKYLEYAKMALNGIKNPDLIVEGWVNEAKISNDSLNEIQLSEILKRREICSLCPFNSINAQNSEQYFDIFKEYYKTDRNELHCSLCLCPIKTKTASLHSDCGMAANKKTKDLELKWKAFNN